MSDQDVASLILSEHDVFRRDFDALEGQSGEQLQQAWDRLAEALEVHAAGEEAVFYPHVVRQLAGGEGDTEHALHDHDEIRAAAQAVAGHETGSDAWWEAVRHAQEVNGDHMAEEERDILGDFKERVAQEQRDELGLAWLAFHEEHARAQGLSGEQTTSRRTCRPSRTTTSRRRPRRRGPGGDALEDGLLQRREAVLEVHEQALQPRHAAPAADQPELHLAGVRRQRDVQGLPVGRDRQRVEPLQPRAVPVQRVCRGRARC